LSTGYCNQDLNKSNLPLIITELHIIIEDRVMLKAALMASKSNDMAASVPASSTLRPILPMAALTSELPALLLH
jgi:hypothetical protein